MVIESRLATLFVFGGIFSALDFDLGTISYQTNIHLSYLGSLDTIAFNFLTIGDHE